MTPVDQRILDHDPARGRVGDCMRACVASLLDLPYEEVPHFFDGEGAEHGYEALRAWLAVRGLSYVELPLSDPLPSWFVHTVRHYILIGRQQGGTIHAVIGRHGEQLHDPHLLRRGVRPLHEGGHDYWRVGMFLRLL